MVRTASKAIIIQDSKILVIKKEDETGPFYILPGGGQEHGENLHENLKRECMEEIGVEVEIDDLIFVRDYVGGNHEYEWDKGFHQLDLMFLCRIKEGQKAPAAGVIPDEGQIGVEWLPVKKLTDYRLYPVSMLPSIMEFEAGKKPEKIYLGDVN